MTRNGLFRNILAIITFLSSPAYADVLCGHNFKTIESLQEELKKSFPATLGAKDTNQEILIITDHKTGTIWNFTTPKNSAHPSVACRWIADNGSESLRKTEMACGAPQGKCHAASPVFADVICGYTFKTLESLQAALEVYFPKTSSEDHKMMILTDNKNQQIWNFTTPQHPAYPSVACRTKMPNDSGSSYQTELSCGNSKNECDKLYGEYQKLDAEEKKQSSNK